MAEQREFIFISYAHENLDQVNKVYEGLKEREVNVWFDKKDMGPGRWKPQILKAISRSKYFVICLSNAALKKTSGEKPGFQDEELQIAWEYAREQDERGFTIIPVRLEDCDRGDMRLSGWQQYDLFKDFEKELDKLAVDMGGISLSDATAKDERTEDEKLIAGMRGKADVFYYLGESQKALSIVESLPEINPDRAEAWNNKGNEHFRLSRYKEAIEAYNKAIEIKPDDHEAWTNKGYAIARLGSYEETLEVFNKAIEIKPNFADAWYKKGAALDDLDRHEEALEAYNKAIEIEPDNLDAWYNKGLALKRFGRHEEALVAFNKVVEIRPNNYNAWYLIWHVLNDLGRNKEALEAYKKGKELDPHSDLKITLRNTE